MVSQQLKTWPADEQVTQNIDIKEGHLLVVRAGVTNVELNIQLLNDNAIALLHMHKGMFRQYKSNVISFYVPLWRSKICNGDHLHLIEGVLCALQWLCNEHDGVSNHRRLECLLNRLFRRRSKKSLKLRLTGLCEENSQVTGEFPAQKANYAERVSIWWRNHMWLGNKPSPTCHDTIT